VISPTAIIVAVAVMVVITVAGVGIILVHGIHVEGRDRLRRPLQAQAVRILCRALAGFDVDGDDLALVGELSSEGAVDAVTEAVAVVDVDDPETLRFLARAFALDKRARLLVQSRFWWRQLKGLRLAALLRLEDDVFADARTNRQAVIRARAADVLAQRKDPASVGFLVEMLEDPNGLTRFAAANALTRIGSNTGPVLARYLKGADPGALPLALDVARALRDPGLLPTIAPFVGHDRSEVRAAAVAALGEFGSPNGLELVRAALLDEEPTVRLAAVRSLGRARQWQAGTDLLGCVDDRDEEVSRAAGRALLDVGASGTLLLRRGLHRDGRAGDICRHMLDVRQALGVEV